ncbi:MAG: GNAT family N-acetyltransferase [Eubacteriales bacterium]
MGVHPDYRKKGIARGLYSAFFEKVLKKGCEIVRSVTSPVNKGSIAFHTRMGFQIEKGDGIVGGIPVSTNYDGRGQNRVLFVRQL